MTDRPIVNVDLDCGILQLSNEDIDLVCGGRRLRLGGPLAGFSVLIDLWNSYSDPIAEIITDSINNAYLDLMNSTYQNHGNG
ncbi:MAG: hypothetical protein OXE80_08180 [Gammaproteobacteria bacterium]|nr:hypothetical protein [Gammaproteobacteria bacterium]